MQALDPQGKNCDVNVCNSMANFRITFDCGEGDEQIIDLCQIHYENHDVLPSGEKYYYFKKFAKNIEVLAS